MDQLGWQAALWKRRRWRMLRRPQERPLRWTPWAGSMPVPSTSRGLRVWFGRNCWRLATEPARQTARAPAPDSVNGAALGQAVRRSGTRAGRTFTHRGRL